MSFNRKMTVNGTKRLMFFFMDYIAFYPIILMPFFASKTYFILLGIYFFICAIISLIGEGPINILRNTLNKIANNNNVSILDKESWHPSNMNKHEKFDL